ncbi:terminase large subunit domain-containing protein [Liquorilactobacillus hordei]|uniref:Prophage terminase, ATP subunit n=1 Tax=Liquorilactobacillus hordei DSM 19519 TaxID=1423759 RepID=A0A0R1MIQ6_9LACO|nr:terminase large subunit [Liquorilactobacillus hordei]KRL07917.1 prophage terminase, ATP subunit [Liquorilactobacillus hordei DSM 19519]QYH50989.1 terminase [Liquorilactobacillus hordei DSM 19519]QYH51136.1 terminase [Liquorilactobacillus hordei DSM 19519]
MNGKKKNETKQDGYLHIKEENMMKWVGYWRKNPQKFVTDYLGMNLFLYQKILMYMMGKIDFFMYIAARGQGKSYLIAIFCIVRSILYPSSNIILASGTRGQASKIITEKIVSLYNNYPAVRYEIGDIKNIKNSINDTSVTFPNGSKIQAVTSNDNARGLRGNILVVDEFRLVKKDVVDKILKPMLNVNRHPAFMDLPEYKDVPTEENKELYISSAWYKTNWIWDSFKDFVKKMIKNQNTFVVDLPYQLSIKHKLLSQDRVMQQRSAENMDQTGFAMEYEALFVGENDKAYYKLAPLNKIRTINKTFMPPTDMEFIENKARSNPKKLSNLKRIDNSEIRLVALDIALMGGNKNVKNDTSAFTCFRLIKDGDEYRRDIVYLESIQQSIATEDLAIRLKQLYYDFEADYVVMDANGNGLGVFDACCRVLYDKNRDTEYPAWACVNDQATNERNKTDGLKMVYTVKANAQFNHEIAVQLKTVIENGKLRLPMNDIEKREELVSEGGFVKKSAEEQHRDLYAYQQASALVNELVNLEYDIRDGGYIRIHEVGSTTKDRYSSIAYGNYYANEFEKKLKDNYSDKDLLNYLMM